MKMTLGCRQPATANRARTIFSPSPIHFEVKEEAEMEKNVALHGMHSRDVMQLAVNHHWEMGWVHTAVTPGKGARTPSKATQSSQNLHWSMPSMCANGHSSPRWKLQQHLMFAAMALPMSVLPVPGGPNRSRPLGGARAPCNAFTTNLAHCKRFHAITRTAGDEVPEWQNSPMEDSHAYSLTAALL